MKAIKDANLYDNLSWQEVSLIAFRLQGRAGKAEFELMNLKQERLYLKAEIARLKKKLRKNKKQKQNEH